MNLDKNLLGQILSKYIPWQSLSHANILLFRVKSEIGAPKWGGGGNTPEFAGDKPGGLTPPPP